LRSENQWILHAEHAYLKHPSFPVDKTGLCKFVHISAVIAIRAAPCHVIADAELRFVLGIVQVAPKLVRPVGIETVAAELALARLVEHRAKTGLVKSEVELSTFSEFARNPRAPYQSYTIGLKRGSQIGEQTYCEIASGLCRFVSISPNLRPDNKTFIQPKLYSQ
jgi:hypothetical protein